MWYFGLILEFMMGSIYHKLIPGSECVVFWPSSSRIYDERNCFQKAVPRCLFSDLVMQECVIFWASMGGP